MPTTKTPLRAALTCPLSGALLTNAVLACDGYVYDADALQAHLDAAGDEAPLSPVTRAPSAEWQPAEWQRVARQRVARRASA